MNHFLGWLTLSMVGCGGALTPPDWTENCDCAQGEICVYGGLNACEAVPPECEAAYSGTCDLAQLDDPCTAVLCGYVQTADGEIDGTTSIEAECWSNDGPTERWFDCDAPLTF